MTAESERGDVVLRVDGICKRFGDLVAVDRISFDVHRGEILGFLGPNGAGKTTSLKMFELLTVGVFPFFILMFFSECMFPLPKIPVLALGGHTFYANDILPTTLCVRAFNKILSFGAGLGDVSVELGAILVLTVGYFSVGTWLFGRRHQRV